MTQKNIPNRKRPMYVYLFVEGKDRDMNNFGNSMSHLKIENVFLKMN